MLMLSIMNTLEGAGDLLVRAWRRHQAWLELRQLGSGDLKDIGLSSGDAWSAAEAYGRGEEYRHDGVFVDKASAKHDCIPCCA